MPAFVLLAILIMIAPANFVSSELMPANFAENTRITIHGMTFSSNNMQMTKSEIGEFTCELEGNVKIALDPESDLTAQKAIVMSKSNGELMIQCTGQCVWQTSNELCKADKIELVISGKINGHRMQMTGNCYLEEQTGDDKVVFQAEKIISQNDTLHLIAPGTIRVGNNRPIQILNKTLP